MPSVITISQLSYAAPDGHQLFSNLNLSFSAGRIGIVGRNGVGKSTFLGLLMGSLGAFDGSIAVSGRLAVLRQTLDVDARETVVDVFGVRAPWEAMQRAVAGVASIDDFEDIDWTLEARIETALASFGVMATPETPLARLSGGQRMRVALAALEFEQADIIVLDEPTNNLDADGRAAVRDLLERWRGTALVVSHDRELLEAMDTIVELTTLGAKTYGGNFSFYQERKALELDAAQRGLAVAERELSEASRQAQVVKERQEKRTARGKRLGAQGGIPRLILGGLQAKAEGTASSLKKQGQEHIRAANAAVAEARQEMEVLTPFAVTLAPTGLHAGKVLLRATGLTGGYEVESPVIKDFNFEMIGPERVALVGRNGAGKSTALKLLTGELPAMAGRVEIFGPVVVLDQEVRLLDGTQTVLENFLRMNPGSTGHDARAVLAAFKFRNDAALQTVGTLSGGEKLRAGLASVLGAKTPPMLVVLDEPTNHLDIEAIEVVEAGLRAFDGALLVVSHDQRFLEKIGVRRWVEIGEA